MRIEPGTVVAGRYEVERTLGQGGMGAVFQALDRKFGARVALKVAAATGAGHDEFKARFAREARIGHRLGRRRGVVRALDWGELDDGVRLYVALDLVEGARPLTLTCGSREERLRRLLRATEIVADAHRQGVVHRDLKPANLLEDADGELYLADFGLAKVMDEPTGDDGGGALTAPMTRSGLAFGTPLFMAPEQFDDAKRVDARADVYALGVMLHLALTGEYPYPGSDPMSVAIKQQKVLEGMSPAPTPRDRDPGVPEALDRLCARAMAARPDERLASAELLAAGLREHLALPPAVVETVARRDGPPAPAAAVARAEAPTQLEPPPAGPSGPSGPTGDVAAAPTGGAASGGRRLRRVLLSGAGLAALWLLLVVVVQFTGAPAAALLSVLPIAKLVDFTEPGVELEHRPLLGEAWSASRTLVLRGVVADASPDTITLVAGREIGAPQPLRAGQHLQHFEVPVTLSGPGRHGVSLWIRDRADNEAVTGLGIVHHPVQVTLVVTERRGDLAVVQGRLTPAPPGPYVVFGGGQPLRCLEPTFTLEVPVTPDQTVVHLVVRPPFGDALEPRAALP